MEQLILVMGWDCFAFPYYNKMENFIKINWFPAWQYPVIDLYAINCKAQKCKSAFTHNQTTNFQLPH